MIDAGFSPDERYILSKDDRGIIKLWDPKNGNKINDPNLVPLKQHPTPYPVHSRDGKWTVESRSTDVLLVDLEARSARLARDKNRLATWGLKSGE